MILKLMLELPEDRSYTRLARVLGKSVLGCLHVSTRDIEDMESILDELCTNVVRHAHSEDGRFTVKLEYHADRVVITVTDKGNGFTFADIPPQGTLRADFDNGERLGGFGLQIVGALANKLNFCRTDDHGTTVRAEKLLTYETQAASESAIRLDEDDHLGAGYDRVDRRKSQIMAWSDK